MDKGGPVNIFVASHESFVSWNMLEHMAVSEFSKDWQILDHDWTMIGPWTCHTYHFQSFPIISIPIRSHKYP